LTALRDKRRHHEMIKRRPRRRRVVSYFARRLRSTRDTVTAAPTAAKMTSPSPTGREETWAKATQIAPIVNPIIVATHQFLEVQRRQRAHRVSAKLI
jgi:hypothetical protein